MLITIRGFCQLSVGINGLDERNRKDSIFKANRRDVIPSTSKKRKQIQEAVGKVEDGKETRSPTKTAG